MNNIPWKWGDPTRHKTLDDFPALANFLKERWNIQWESDFTIPASISLPNHTEEKIAEIRAVFPSISPEKIDFSTAARLRVAVGKSYHDILRIHTDDKLLVPDFVFYPSTREELDYFVKKASQNKIRLSPFGGGTNVVGALTIQDREALNCRVDLRNFNALIELDETHLTATFQSGILGPDLESALNEKGYTMGHFPQSFEHTTLGGWVATRSAGQESSYYGKIEDMVERISVVTPVGIIRTNPYTHDASGINLKTLFIGSEGTLGIIAEVTVKIHKTPEATPWIIALFPDFKTGTEYLHTLSQSGAKPAIVRLSDACETQLYATLSSTNSSGYFQGIKKRVQRYLLKRKNLDAPCILMMRFVQKKGEDPQTQVRISKKLLAKHKGVILAKKVGIHWAENRFNMPYLRDPLVSNRVMIDTMETLVKWKDVQKIYDLLTERLASSEDFGKEKGLFLAHISHLYTNAACMYFTLMTPMKKGSEIKQWKMIKKLVTDTIVENGGAVSHHHSVGLDHQKWYLKQCDPISLNILKNIKKTLDPNQIMNPGKLFSKAYKTPYSNGKINPKQMSSGSH